LDFTKIKNICSLKDPVKRVRKQGTDWKKIFTNPVSDRGLKTRMHKEFSKLHNKKTTH